MELNFVLCPRFHGATALALLLNNHSGVSSLGDMFPSGEFDQSCGCGNKVSHCPFWHSIALRFPDMRQPGSRSLYPCWPRCLTRNDANSAVTSAMSLVSLRTTPSAWRLLGDAGGKFIRFYLDFVNAVNEYHGASVFVNGQKSLRSVLAIKSILGDRARIRIIHLFRDPRAFHCSEKASDSSIDLDDSARRWCAYHRRVQGLVCRLTEASYLAVRYEDLCEQPASTMEKLFEFIGAGYQDVFRPPSLHHVVGHRSKDRFDGTLRQSMTWRNALSVREQERCLTLTQPESEQLGYRQARE